MRYSHHQIEGTFNSITDLRLAYSNLKHKQFKVLEVKAKTESQEYERLNESDLLINTSYVDSAQKITIMLMWSALSSIILGVFALFNFWDPADRHLTVFAVVTSSIVGAVFGFLQGKKHIARKFMKPIRKPILKKGKILVDAKSDKEMIQVKSVLYENHAKKISLI